MEDASESFKGRERDVLTFPRAVAAYFGAGSITSLILAWAERDDPRWLATLLTAAVALACVCAIFAGAYVIQLRQRRDVGADAQPWPLRPTLAHGLLVSGVLASAGMLGLGFISILVGHKEILLRAAVGVAVGCGLFVAGFVIAPPPKPKVLPLIGIAVGLAVAITTLALLAVRSQAMGILLM